MSKQLAVSKHLFMHHGEISDGGGDGYPEVETETEEEVEVMEMKMIWILLLGGLSKPDLAEKNGPAGETDGGRKGGGKAVPFESKLYQYYGPFHSWYSRPENWS